MGPHSRDAKKNTSHGNELLLQDFMYVIQRPCNHEEVCAKMQQAIHHHEDLTYWLKKYKLKWYGHICPASGLAKTSGKAQWKGKEDNSDWKEVGRQHQGMDRPWVCQVSEGRGEQRKMEETGCEVVCCVPTTVMVKVYVKVKVSRTLLFFQTAEELFCKSFLGSPITRKVWPTLLSLLFLIWLMTLLNSVCTVLPSIESLFYHSCWDFLWDVLYLPHLYLSVIKFSHSLCRFYSFLNTANLNKFGLLSSLVTSFDGLYQREQNVQSICVLLQCPCEWLYCQTLLKSVRSVTVCYCSVHTCGCIVRPFWTLWTCSQGVY